MIISLKTATLQVATLGTATAQGPALVQVLPTSLLWRRKGATVSALLGAPAAKPAAKPAAMPRQAARTDAAPSLFFVTSKSNSFPV